MHERLQLAENLMEIVSEVENQMRGVGWGPQIENIADCIQIGELEVAAESLIDNLYNLSISLSQKSHDTLQAVLRLTSLMLTEGDTYRNLLTLLVIKEN